MTEFISLEEFLLLPETNYKEFREFYKHKTGTQWWCWYQLAKASFNQFGESGPPIGSKVFTLVSGHGGGGGNQRIFGGQYLDKDNNPFKDANENYFFLKYENEKSLVNKSSWWREIISIETVDLPPFPKDFYRRPRDSNLEAYICLITRG